MLIETMTLRLNELKTALEEKGATNVRVEFEMNQEGPYRLYMAWRDVMNELESYSEYVWDHPTGLYGMIGACAERVQQIPEAEDAKKAAAYKLLAQVKEKFDKFGIEADFTNPLEDMMKKLSSNALK